MILAYVVLGVILYKRSQAPDGPVWFVLFVTTFCAYTAYAALIAWRDIK
jgi:hypothetical protein